MVEAVKSQTRGLLIVGGVLAGLGGLWYVKQRNTQLPTYYGGPVSSKQILSANAQASFPTASEAAFANLQGQVAGPGTAPQTAYYQNPQYGIPLYPQPNRPIPTVTPGGPGGIATQGGGLFG